MAPQNPAPTTPRRYAYSSNGPAPADNPNVLQGANIPTYYIDPFERRFDIPSRHSQDEGDCFLGSIDYPLHVDSRYFTTPQYRQLLAAGNPRELIRRQRLFERWRSRLHQLRTIRAHILVAIKRAAFTIVAREWAALDSMQRNLMMRENRVRNNNWFRHFLPLIPAYARSPFLVDQAYGLSSTALREQYTFPYGSPLLHDHEAAFLYYAMLLFRAHNRNSLSTTIEKALRLEFTDSRPVRFMLRAGLLDRGINGRYTELHEIHAPERSPW